MIDQRVSVNQNAFIKGMQKTDAAIVAIECIDQLLKSKKKRVA